MRQQPHSENPDHLLKKTSPLSDLKKDEILQGTSSFERITERDEEFIPPPRPMNKSPHPNLETRNLHHLGTPLQKSYGDRGTSELHN